MSGSIDFQEANGDLQELNGNGHGAPTEHPADDDVSQHPSVVPQTAENEIETHPVKHATSEDEVPRVAATNGRDTFEEVASPAASPSSGSPGKEGEKKKRMFNAGVCVREPYGVDCDYLFNMMERKNMETMNDKIGGIEGLAFLLNTHPERGIDPETVQERKEKYGANVMDRKECPPFWEFYLEACKDPLIIILLICAVIGIIFGMTLENPHSGEVERETGWIEGTAIIISVLVVTLTQSITNYQKAKRFEEMEREQSVQEVQVYRAGHDITIMSDEIVVGDLLVIEGGTMLNCDGVMVHGNDLKCNESAMTGEPDVIKKSHEKDPFFLSGTVIEEGTGRMFVIAVGMESIQGRLKEATEEEQSETPLQENLGNLADKIAKIAFILSFLLLIALCIKEGILISTEGKKASAASFLNFVIISVALVVVAVPEGLPLAVTISLAFGMKSMMDDNCMVRILASCETMGAATAICSDKTGTLTTNVMSVVQGVVGTEEFFIAGYGLRPRHGHDPTVLERTNPAFKHLNPKVIDDFCAAIALNSTAREQELDGRIVWVGNKTEHGLLGFCNLTKRDYKAVRAGVSETDMRQYPFNSKKKRMSTIVKVNGKATLYLKGASEVVLEDCDRFVNEKGDIVKMAPENKKLFQDMIMDMANQGNRTIAIASMPFEGDFPEDDPDYDTCIFMGVLGIQDPIREEVPEAVLNCKKAGIAVRMVTGDNINTAIAIAKKCNIYEDNNWDHAMTGQEFRDMYSKSKEELLELLPRLRVLARSSPQDKYILVGMLQELGEVVGVTGDGTNDAPALSLANVGFAMQIGTDIAKGAADMVLLDNNFASVVNAVRWGRSINDNIRKFLQYQLSINTAGVILTFVGALASPTSKEPFSAVQLLWLNLIMDTLAALALATERPSMECLNRLPSFKQTGIMTRRMVSFVVGHGVFQVTIILVILFVGHTLFQTTQGSDCDFDFTTNTSAPIYLTCEAHCKGKGGKLSGRYCQQGEVHSTIIFNTFILFQLFNGWNARKLYGEWNIFEGIWERSKPFLGVMVLIALFQVFAVEAAGKFLQTTSLSVKGWYWGLCIGIAFVEIPLGVIIRMLPVEEPVPDEVQARWDRENLLRERRGLPPIHHNPAAAKRTLIKSGDPALTRRHSMMTRSDSMTGHRLSARKQ